MMKDFKKVSKYIFFAINSLLAGFGFILFHKVFLDNINSDLPFFSALRIILFISISCSMFLIFSICSLGEKRKKIEYFIEKIGKHPLTFVVLLSFVFRILYFSRIPRTFIIYYDTKTYTDYPFNIFLGETDIFRTPGYPYFLKAIHHITRIFENDVWFYEKVSIFQIVISLASLVLLYLAGRKLFSNKYILSACVLVCGIAPSVFNWDIIILTESISLFVTVLLIYLVFTYLAQPKFYLAIIIGLYAIVMIMIRPTFIYVLAILAVFFIARMIFNAKERKKALAGLLSVALSVLTVLGYCGLNYKNYDYFTVSSVSNTVNNLYIVMVNGWYDNEDYPELSKYISDGIEYGNGNWITDIIEVAPDYYSYPEIDAYVSDCLKKHNDEYLTYTLNKFKYNLDTPVPTNYIPIDEQSTVKIPILNKEFNFKEFSDFLLKWTFPFDFLRCFVLVGVSLILAVLVLIIKKRIMWQVVGLCAIIFSHIFVSVFGSMAEYSRLSIMVVPAVLLLVFYYFDYLVSAIKHKKLFYLTNNNSSAIRVKKESD